MEEKEMNENYSDIFRKVLTEYYQLVSQRKKKEWIEFAQYKWDIVMEVRKNRNFSATDASLSEMIVIEWTHSPQILKKYKEMIHLQEPEEEALALTWWQKIMHKVEKEQEWEKCVVQSLNELAEKHPLISKALITVLSGLLIGLLTNCIYEGITTDQTKITGQEKGKFISELLLEKGEDILIEGDDGKEYYKILYFTKEGVPKEGLIAKDSVEILYKKEESNENNVQNTK